MDNHQNNNIKKSDFEKHQIKFYSYDYEGILYGKKGEELLRFIFTHSDVV